MDRFDSLQLFTRIVELGSFSRAAAALDIPRATATHAIKQLEASLGARLLDRTTRHVRATPDGQAFYERCVHVLSELDDAQSSLQRVASNPRGLLRVDMHSTHATKIVLPRIDDFRARYPGIDLVVSGGDRLVDLVREGIDCVIRAGNPRDSSLVARRLAVMPQVICASPEYLAAFGAPRHPDELPAHRVVKFFAASAAVDYPLELRIGGEIRAFALNGWISVSDAENYVVCALRGCGLIQLPRFHVEDDLRAGRLVEVLSDWPSPDLPVSALYPSHRHLSPRVRVFVDWLGKLYEEAFPAAAPPRR
ncbi:LysR family transcriptional regulator [Bordetella bronchiseptica]|uniref:LysR family transcriptional regulator n=1 Tax=Bordetella bronchiseptica TaxID=518 RepID=UPI00028B5CEE|nr:LysR family transcriptional regulator [Bordetella bronchiseptica]KDD54938.1 LysR substrate-binding domain protein [Bordetella bronchiseptica OSU553]AUL15865.1 LysR family transcriptional regulator [Bordetella bronchiseptica]AWP58969.1 LysR family transcriptional regulator [Bordetella bronchiseptica]AWQ05716.1 LysR family transcriptional regulator [Bordetella bronchiseptica]AZW31284.1 LysR family transcriptional regulator [Bordetella bronchiseptica]